MNVITPGAVLLGKFRVERILGKGGMGVVVAARHVTLDEPVAIKFLNPDVVNSPSVVERFLREARASVKIKSEHVARVTDVGTMESGSPYMVMEYLHGCDLGELLQKRGRLEVAEACEYVLQACEALAEAHALGIVHRDVKPANLFLTRRADGSPCLKVLDFGISKVRGAGEHSLTKTQAMMGSPLYMSPEQLSSAKNVDPRADVYALGAVLFELLTGQAPYDGEDIPQLVVQVLHAPIPSLRSFRPDAPPALEAIVSGCLAKDRNARVPDVGVLARALGEIVPHARISADRTGRIVASSELARSSSSSEVQAMPALPASAITSPTWQSQTASPASHTTPGAPSRSRALAMIGAFFGSAVVACVIALVVIRLAGSDAARSTSPRKTPTASPDDEPANGDDPSTAEPEPSESAPVAPAKTKSPDPVGVPPIAPAPSTSAPPVASASASPSTAPSNDAPTSSPPSTTKPKTPYKPAPKKGDDDPFGKHVL